MGEPASISSARPAPGSVLIVGRISRVEKITEGWLHTVMLPAADQFSAPGVVVVKSSRQFGQVGQDVSQGCIVSGYEYSYDGKDGKKKRVVVQLLAD